ncbi:MAG: TIGR00296 family protein [Desulfurococcaceae archaeon]
MRAIHPLELSFEEGVYLVKLARKAIEEYLKNKRKIRPDNIPSDKLLRPGMTFTTIETMGRNGKTSLRGCIGFLQPIYSLLDSTIESAIEAAVNDPRFPPMKAWELDHVVIEVTVLSEPVELVVDNRWNLARHVVIGKHGLVAEKGWFKGTLLPIVPVEYCWDEETFLSETCIKAGLRPDCWLDPAVKISVYEGRVFREKEPRGEIYERDMSAEYVRICGGDK